MQLAQTLPNPLRKFNRLLVLCSILIIIYALLFSWQSWTEKKASRIKDLKTIVEMGEKSLDQYFLQVEADLHNLALNWTDDGQPLNQERAYRDAVRYHKLHPELVNLTVFKADGEILFTAKTAPSAAKRSLAKESSFVEFQKNMEKLPNFTIGQPIFGATSKVWIVPMRFKVVDKDGKVQFVISSNLPVEFLQRAWHNAPITERSALGLLRDDGFLLSRYPLPATKNVNDLYGKPRVGAFMTLMQQQNFPKDGVVDNIVGLDDVPIMTVYCRLTHFPIIMFVVMPLEDIRREWWDGVKVPYSLTFILLLIAIFSYHQTIRRNRAWLLERERLDRLKGEFISVVSHELRTPITSVRGSLGLLAGGAVGPLSEPALKLVRIAYKNSERLSNLVNDILDMEKLMLGKVTLNIQLLDLAALVQAGIDINEAYAQRLNVGYLLLPTPDKCMVNADSERLTQVLTNLLSNGAKFSPSGEKVTIRILEKDGRYLVEVADRGPGVPSAFQSRIFTPFSQADSTDTRQQGGTGLGLHISKTLIEKMGGEIGFRSIEGQGSTFWFALPKDGA